MSKKHKKRCERNREEVKKDVKDICDLLESVAKHNAMMKDKLDLSENLRKAAEVSYKESIRLAEEEIKFLKIANKLLLVFSAGSWIGYILIRMLLK